jgi:hypothetical protein
MHTRIAGLWLACLLIVSSCMPPGAFQGAPPNTGAEAAPEEPGDPNAVPPGDLAASPDVAANSEAVAPAVPAPAPAPVAAPGACPNPGSDQLAQLLLSSPWCHFSYSGGSMGGTSRQERVVFSNNGSVSMTGGSESSYSGQLNNQYGDQTAAWGTGSANNDGTQGCWRAEGAVLFLTAPNGQQSQVLLQVTQNSNGYPIINAGGKEYATCN